MGIIIIKVSIAVGLILGAIVGAVYVTFIKLRRRDSAGVNNIIIFFTVFVVSSFLLAIISIIAISLYFHYVPL